MTGSFGEAARRTAVRQPLIEEAAAQEAAALLAASRELIAEARGILADARGPAIEKPGEAVPDQLSVGTIPLASPGTKSGDHLLGRRLLTAVPAAAGVALLGMGLASLTGGNAQHAVTLDVQGSSSHPSSSPSTKPPASGTAGAVLPEPISLSVPRLHSKAVVAGEVSVQTAGPEAGLLNAPADLHQLGWYRHGDTGALVLDGHVGYRNAPGPLAFIGSLGVGDVVMVGFPSGDRAFSVTVVGRSVKGQLPQQFFSDGYDGDVMLITCDYTSPFRAGHFQDNVYVVAAPSQ